MAEVSPQLLLDTHIVMRWMYDSKHLSKEQLCAIEASTRRKEPLGVSAISLPEIAIHVPSDKLQIDCPLDDFLNSLGESPFHILPLTSPVACEAAALQCLRDPADQVIAATARGHGLRLVTSDQRIIESNLVSTLK